MKYVIIGLGISGVTAAKTIRSLDKEAEIEIFSDEMSYYYPRPKLFKLLSKKMSARDIYFYEPSWYIKNNFALRLGINVDRVDTKAHKIYLNDGGSVGYDKLLIANGAHSFVPPIPGNELQGVYTLRNLKDAMGIKEYSEFLEDGSNVAVIGGGVLGLEMAHSLKLNNLNPTVIEYGPYLLPRQLDEEGAEILRTKFEKEGIRIRVNTKTESIDGKNSVDSVSVSGGEKIPAKMVILSTGVRSNIELAKKSNFSVNRGIVVDDFLHITDESDVFAAGDIAEHNGKVYGIIPPALEQATIAAKNMVKDFSAQYKGSIPNNTLKVVGMELTSIGEINPQEITTEYTILKVKSESEGKYRKVVLKNNKVVGIILLGFTGGESVYASKLVRDQKDLSNHFKELEDISFSLKSIY